MKEYLPQMVAFALFIVGLVAWRFQMLDKRRFEVAELVIVTYRKILSELRLLRKRNSWENYPEYKKKNEPKSPYAEYRQRRWWRYRIPDERLRAFEDVYKELGPTEVLARRYLSREANHLLSELRKHFRRIVVASECLIEMEQPPNSIDPESDNNEPVPLPDDSSGAGHKLTLEKTTKLEKQYMHDRFQPWGTDALYGATDDIISATNKESRRLEDICAQYSDANPYRFLARLGWSLIGPLVVAVLSVVGFAVRILVRLLSTPVLVWRWLFAKDKKTQQKRRGRRPGA